MNIAKLTKPRSTILEQNCGPTLLKTKLEMLDLPFDEQILINDASHMHYSVNEKRIITRTIYSADSITLISAKLVTCKSFCLDNYSIFITIITSNSGKTPCQFKIDARKSAKVLLSINCNKCQKLDL